MKVAFRNIVSILMIFLVVAVASLVLAPARTLAAPAASPGAAIVTGLLQQAPTPDEISAIVLGILGSILSLVFMYWPEAKKWYEGLPHQGIVMLGMVVLVGLAYFGLSCTALAVPLHIQIACTSASAFDLARAILIIAVGNQLTYLFAPTPKQ